VIQVLSRSERSAMERFRFRDDQLRYGIAHAAVRVILSGYVREEPNRIELERDRLGKPRVVGSNVRYSLAHAGEYALVAIGRHRPLGVDLEPVRELPDADQLTRSCFTARERAHLQNATTEELLRLWTRKEAVLKATGEGLRRRLDELDVLDETGQHGWLIVDVALAPRYVGAVAMRDDVARITTRTFSWE
jgi:4'-phosphopantetheinyl transferase